jgi:hypothetical protein
MMHAVNHLTADDLDALVADQSSPELSSHLATCAACAKMVASDRRLVVALGALPMYEPAAGFSARVMAGVHIAVAPVPVFAPASDRAVAARRRAVGALVVTTGGLLAGFAWATTHPSDALRWSTPAVQGAGHALWTSLQQMVGSAIDQPWFASVRDTITTPLRGLLVTAAVAGVYALALLGLRGLMTEPATDAGW